MPAPSEHHESELLHRARAGDTAAFDGLVEAHRWALHAHCYRMLGSPQDADDALQETLLAAWKGLKAFEGRSALRTWLYRIATNVCLRFIASRPRRIESPDHGPACQNPEDLGEMVLGPVWLEPLPDAVPRAETLAENPLDTLDRRESVALAFVAALQHLPGRQRAALLLREVLGYSAAEAAAMLSTSVASLNSALQRAQKTLRDKLPAKSQAKELEQLGEAGLQRLLGDFVHAWENRDLDSLVRLLTEDVRFTMPALPAWFDGRAMVASFLAKRVFATPWRLLPLRANGQAGFACYMQHPGADRYSLGALTLLSLRDGRVQALHSFLDPALHRRFGLPADLA